MALTFFWGSLSLGNLILVFLTLILSWASIILTRGLITYFERVKAPRVGKNPLLVGIRHAREDFARNGKPLTKEGYDKFRDSMYLIQTGDMERLVVSNSFVDELRKLPDSYLDSRLAVVERNLGWYNGVDIILESTTHVDVCRTKLVQELGNITNGQVKVLDYIFHQELGACVHDHATESQFQFHNAAETILHIVNRAVAASLVGEPLSRNESWLHLSLESTINTGLLCRQLQDYPAFIRPLVSPYTTSRRKLKSNLDAAQKLLEPIIASRERYQDNIDILQWLLDTYEGQDLDQSGSFITRQVLFLVTAATRSTANTIVNIIFDLLAYPECQELLRAEIRDSVSAAGGWNITSLSYMKKLDSFIKESQRLNHHILLNFNRKTRRPITLSNGAKVPTGTFLCVPGYWAARDPEIFPDGQEFVPWRWFDLREEAERQGKSPIPYLASSTSSENLYWGYGRNACPGRFMAAAELKLIVAWTLWHYDICFPQGQTQRPESIFVDERVFPDPAQNIGFKKRKANIIIGTGL